MKNIYYDKPVPPVRDTRLVIGDSFHGCPRELLGCAKSGCMLRQSRSFWQAVACQMTLSLQMAATIENAVIIMHAPVGCGATLTQLGSTIPPGMAKRGKTGGAPVWLTTNLRDTDIITGGAQKLYDTIRYADAEFRPEVIFVIVTCAPSIIGDDVDEVVDRAKQDCQAEVAALHCPGFKSRVVASAYDAFYHALIRHIPLEPIPYRDLRPIERGSTPDYEGALRGYVRQKNYTVNVFNASSMGADDEAEIARLLSALGLKPRIYTEWTNLAELRLIGEAGLNVSMCDVHDDYFLNFLEEKFGIPYIISGMPLGFKATRDWIMKIARFFDVERAAEAFIDDEEERCRDAIAPFLKETAGKTAIICGGVIRSASEALMLTEMGLTVIGVRAYHYDSGAEDVIEEVARRLPDVPLMVSNQLFELVNQIKRLKPDIVVSHGGTHGILAKIGANSMPLFDQNKPFFGYSGIYRFARRVSFGLKNKSWQERLASHIKLPYKESWYAKDAYSYIKEE